MTEELITYLINLIKPELMLLIPIAYIIGTMIKHSESIKDKWIPFILGAINIILSTIYVFATSNITGYQDVFTALFISVTQGILTAGCSVYINQLIKQYHKEE